MELKSGTKGTVVGVNVMNDYYESIEIIKPKHQKKIRKSARSKRKSYHVVAHTTKQFGRKWKVKLAGRSTVPNGTFKNKNSAIARAKKLGKKAKLGQVVIHKLDGTIQTEYTYGEDPKKTTG